MKDIAELDRNMAVANRIYDPEIVWRDARTAPIALEGLYQPLSGGPFRRLPREVAEATSEGVAQLALHTAGGRARFATDSPYVAIHAELPGGGRMDHMAFTGIFGFDLYVKRAGAWAYQGTFRLPVDSCAGYESRVELPGGMCEVMIDFPLYSGVNGLLIGLREGSALSAPCAYARPVPVVYYGSSITQGGCASRPGNSYQAMIGRMLDCDYLNLGFSGNAKGEEAIARYMAGLNMSAFVCDYDHNAPTPEHLAATHRPLYEAVRAKNADVPIIFVTRPNTDWHAYDPGEARDVATRRDIVRDTYEYALAQGDGRVAFIDGATLFEGEMRDCCTVDGCHPNDLGFARMARVIGAELARRI